MIMLRSLKQRLVIFLLVVPLSILFVTIMRALLHEPPLLVGDMPMLLLAISIGYCIGSLIYRAFQPYR